MAMDFKKRFFSHLLMPSNYNAAVTSMCWFYHYRLKLAGCQEREEILLFEN